VFGHVAFEGTLVRQDPVANSAGRFAHVTLKVAIAASLIDVRLVAHAANETPVLFQNLPLMGFPGVWGGRLEPRLACKFQVV
jgi:hypothetical protein